MDAIKVLELFRVIGDNHIPIGDVIPAGLLSGVLKTTLGVKVLNLRTNRVVLRFDEKAWQWNPVDEEFLSDGTLIASQTALAGADGWVELPIASGARRFTKPIPGTLVCYEHELPGHVREHFRREHPRCPICGGDNVIMRATGDPTHSLQVIKCPRCTPIGSPYEQIKNEISDLPQTWYPALLKTMVESAISKKVFLPGGATEFVRKIESPNSIVTTSDSTKSSN